VRETIASELESIRKSVGEAAWSAGKFERAAALFDEIMTSAECAPFMTSLAYQEI